MLPEYDFSGGVRGKYAAYTGAAGGHSSDSRTASVAGPHQGGNSGSLSEDEEVHSAHKGGAPGCGDRP